MKYSWDLESLGDKVFLTRLSSVAREKVLFGLVSHSPGNTCSNNAAFIVSLVSVNAQRGRFLRITNRNAP